MGQIPPFCLLASRCLPIRPSADMLDILLLEDWISQDPVLWVGSHPLCVLVAQSDMPVYTGSALADHFKQMKTPVLEVADGTSVNDLNQLILTQVMAALQTASITENSLRDENAALRADYMQLQQNFAATEDYLYNAFAPRFLCVREGSPFKEQPSPLPDLAKGPVIQRLPVGSKGLVAVDIWLTSAGAATLTFCDQHGAASGPDIEVRAEKEGWARAQIETPLQGLEEDIWVRVSGEAELALALPSLLAPLCAQQENAAHPAPLAMRIWKGLPGVRVPEMKPGPQRHIIPAADLPDPELQSSGRVKRLRGRDAFSLHPAHDGQLDFVFRGVPIASAANIAVYAQNFGPETVKLSMSLAEHSHPPAIYLQAESHGQFDLDVSSPGQVDIFVKLRAPSPVASVFIRGLEICPVVG